MIDTTSLNEPTRNICLVYTGRLDCNESRELNDFILGVGKYEIKRVEIVEYNIVVLLIKSTSAISYNEETILFSALSDRIRSGNIYYCITYLNSGKALVSDKNERFFFTGQSLLNENGFVYYNEQDYIDELKKILEKKMNELSEKSDCMKNELNESKRFKIAEFKRELKFPYNPQDDIIRKNRHENSITAQGCVLEIGNG